MKTSSCFLLLIVVIIHSACAPVTSHYSLIDQHLARQQYAEADSIVSKYKKKYGQRNSVLYSFDRAMTLHLAGRYEESNMYLEKAEIKIDRLFTKSITAEAGAMLTNDNLLPYEGEDFEKVMVHVFAALNYVYLGKWNDALVEARKVDHKLNVFNDEYEEKNVYKEDAYARYLTGILYEAKKELNDAFIAYRKAFDVYKKYSRDYGTPMPPTLPQDLLRTSKALGMTKEHNSYRKKFPNVKWISQKEFDKQGELIFFSYNGRSPVKEDYFITVPVYDKKKKISFFRMALPEFNPLRNNIAYTNVILTGPGKGPISRKAFLAEDITAIAKKNLEDRIVRITAKATARATSKFLLSRKIKKEAENNLLVTILADLFPSVSEQSDKRSWRTLPDQINMVRVAVPPGPYTVSVKYYSAGRNLLHRKEYRVTLNPGEKKFLSYRFLGQ